MLLELFAKTHAAKYDTDIGVLELYQGGRRIDEATLICEVIEDLDATAPALAASFFVKRRHGAAEDAVVSARSLLLQKRAPREIDDWSSQKEVLEANAATGPGEQQTSAEIRAYWDEQKRNGYKHWRTDAALLLQTSGTTGNKKTVPHLLEDLLLGAVCLAVSGQLGPGSHTG